MVRCLSRAGITPFFGGRTAFLYNADGTWTSLVCFCPLGLNDAGEAVAQDRRPERRRLHQYGRNCSDLNTLIDPSSGWDLFSATGINDSGCIVGYGENSSGQEDAFLLPRHPHARTVDGGPTGSSYRRARWLWLAATVVPTAALRRKSPAPLG